MGKGLLIVLLTAMTLACGKRDNAVRIGALATLTGETASFGHAAKGGFELAVEEWNARGGVLGRPIKLVLLDDQGDPAEGATAVTLLIRRDQVAGVAGPDITRVHLAAAPVAQAYGVPLVASGATGTRVTQVGDFVFRACFEDSRQGVEGARFAYQDLKARRAACLFERNSEYARGLAEAFRTGFTEQGGEVVACEACLAGVADFRRELRRLLKAEPDLLFAPAYYPEAAMVVRQARELGYRGPVLGSDGWDSPLLPRLAGADLENTYFTAFFSPQDPDPLAQSFVKAYRSRCHADPDGQATAAYEAAILLLDAIRRAGTTEGGAVRDALADSNLRLVTGQVRFDPQRNPVKPIVVVAMRGGKPVLRTIRAGSPAGL
jgi:branched-chain amino acid transport system substrate-binding protein